jgi:hypothetical protein
MRISASFVMEPSDQLCGVAELQHVAAAQANKILLDHRDSSAGSIAVGQPGTRSIRTGAFSRAA